jgi:two-component system sensor kinase FixL
MDALNGARPEDRYVRVTAGLDGSGMVEFAVGDGGAGIPTARLGQIFEPFFTTKPSGMGLGLAISRTIIEAHRGRLWAENQSGGGAVFRCTLPTAEHSSAD